MKIILFDIDSTIFDRNKYLKVFYDELASKYGLSEDELTKVREFYEEIKAEYGYFSSEAFLARIYKIFPQTFEKLDYYFKEENTSKFLYEDSKVLFELNDARIGIFSKGDTVLQSLKITKFESILDKSLIYIYHNKIEKIKEVFNEYEDSDVYLVDDNLTVLITVKDLCENVKTIFVDRESGSDKPNGIDFKITSLFDIIPILK